MNNTRFGGRPWLNPDKPWTKPGIFPNDLIIDGTIQKTTSTHALHYWKVDFRYCFRYIYKDKMVGNVYVYMGGFTIENILPIKEIYHAPHCAYFTMPYYQHYLANGEFTQFFINNLYEVLSMLHTRFSN